MDDPKAYVKLSTSPPFAGYSLDGVYKGDTPTSGFTAIPPGTHELEFYHGVMGRVVDTLITLRAGEWKEIHVRLAENPN